MVFNRLEGKMFFGKNLYVLVLKVWKIILLLLILVDRRIILILGIFCFSILIYLMLDKFFKFVVIRVILVCCLLICLIVECVLG